MHAIVVYESIWGNTERIARAIAHGLEKRMDVDIYEADAAPRVLDGYDLVLVGGPTHAFSMTRPLTRTGAAQNNAAPKVAERGIREWLDSLDTAPGDVIAAAFDTRVDSPRLPGSAAKAARHELRSLGFDTSTKAESFYVHGYGGPLVDGEVERAATWARGISLRPTPTPAPSAA